MDTRADSGMAAHGTVASDGTAPDAPRYGAALAARRRGRCAVLLAHALLLAALVLGSGCAGVLVGSAATGAVVANDPRTTGTVVEDQAIELKALKLIAADAELGDQAHVGVTSYNQSVLLTGQVPTPALREKAVTLVRGIAKVRHVHDELAIAAPSSLASQTSDGFITTKVKTRLIGTKELSATRIKVVTEAGTVYLLGLVTQAEADAAARVASATDGVSRVVKLFEYP